MAVELKYWPDVYIDMNAKTKLDLYIEFADGEISGLGDVEVLEDGSLFISDVYIFDQESSGASTEIDADTIADFIKECIEQEKDLSKIRLWWHSHGNMNAFWSTTDDQTSGTCFRTAPFFISIVGNKSGDYRVRVDTFMEGGAHLPISMDNIPLKVYHEEDLELRDKIRDEVKDKVTRTHVVTKTWDTSLVFCKHGPCVNKVSTSNETGLCYLHSPLREDEALCDNDDCGKKFITTYDTENTGKCISCRTPYNPTSKSKKEPGSAIVARVVEENDGDDELMAELITERTIVEYGPTVAEAVSIDWDGDMVYERGSKGEVLVRYRLEDNEELYAAVMEALEGELSEEDMDKSLTQILGRSNPKVQDLGEHAGFSEGYFNDW